MDFGKKLQSLRETNGFSLESLAKDLAVSRAALEKYESGETEPSRVFIGKVAEYFQVSAEELVANNKPSRTVNGLPLKDILSKLSSYEKPAGTKPAGGGKKFSYYKIGQYESRLNEVLGIEHYSVSYTEPLIRRIESGQEIMSVNCRITILDDDFRPVFFKEGCGSKELLYTKETSKLDGSGNLAHNASISAFKSACKLLSIFGETNGEEEFEKKDTQQTQQSSVQSKAPDKATKAPEKDIQFCLQSRAEVVKNDNNGKPIYRVNANIIVGNQMETKLSEIIFYPNQYARCVSLVNELAVLTKAARYTLRVSECQNNDGDEKKHFVFKGIPS